MPPRPDIIPPLLAWGCAAAGRGAAAAGACLRGAAAAGACLRGEELGREELRIPPLDLRGIIIHLNWELRLALLIIVVVSVWDHCHFWLVWLEVLFCLLEQLLLLLLQLLDGLRRD